MSSIAKPPIGLRPKFIAEQERAEEICQAILRYVRFGKKIPQEWVDELDSLQTIFEPEIFP